MTSLEESKITLITIVVEMANTELGNGVNGPAQENTLKQTGSRTICDIIVW